MADRVWIKGSATSLAAQLGVKVTCSVGRPEEGDDVQQFLIVWSDDAIDFPNPFDGFKVIKRNIPSV